MAQVVRPRHVGDTRSLLYIQLTEDNSEGTNSAVSLAGLTASDLTFRMVDARGNVILAETSDGIVIRDAASGKITVDLGTAGLSSSVSGTFYGYVRLTDGDGGVSSFPSEEHGFVIPVETD